MTWKQRLVRKRIINRHAGPWFHVVLLLSLIIQMFGWIGVLGVLVVYGSTAALVAFASWLVLALGFAALYIKVWYDMLYRVKAAHGIRFVRFVNEN